MAGKVIIVTGANSGIGYCTARDLASRGGRVILACRDQGRGIRAMEEITKATGNDNVIYKHLNLSSLKSVRNFAEEIIRTEQRVDVLINNAGVHGLADRYTEDDIIETMQINHFAPFLLTVLLLPILIKSRGRIINVGSFGYLFSRMQLEHINTAGFYNETHSYCNSKLCNVLFTKELAKRLEGTGVTANALHPGMIWTNLANGDTSQILRVIFFLICWICKRSVEEGAQTSIYLAVAKECAEASGLFYIDCTPRSVFLSARDASLAAQLWQYSEQLVGYSGESKQN